MFEWIALALIVIAAVFDVKKRYIPLQISAPLLLIAIIFHPHLDGLLAWPIIILGWKMGAIGGGDAKVLMAVALLFGTIAVALAMFLGGLMAFIKKPAPGVVGALIAVTGYLTVEKVCGIM